MDTVDRGRRRLLQGGLALGSALLWGRPGAAWGQSLLSLPKVALVVGNGRYKQAPLKNPTNDAGAMGEALKQAGFEVTVTLNAGRNEMLSMLKAHAEALARKKGVGLFYFAGHGVQLAWRNFLVPVDAEVEKIGDVETTAVDLGGLVAGLTAAANPMNVIILDACRDDPFGEGRRPEQKGLSQMDAPPGTLLAYATAPGNVAADGTGVNGLYTEHLLRELKVPEAKIEDVFKRVRLGVRRKSGGRQIPWESTSLEEDFYFLPPPHLKKASDDEKEKRYKEELALWERAHKAMDAARLEEYLQRYPSGHFAELAQLQIDRVLAKQGEQKVQAAPAEGNPYTKGTAVARTDPKVGDSYVYRELGLGTQKEQRRFTSAVSRVTDAEIVYSDGLITDPLGNVRRFPDGRQLSYNQNVPVEYVVGKQWVSRFTVATPRGTNTTELYFKIVTREPVTVPAGTFNAFRIESHGLSWGVGNMQNQRTVWIAPDKVRRAVAMETLRKTAMTTLQADRLELVSYKES
ncbi:MAG TPA: caspase family protein [Methylomirabilota bacterium]|jgi:hypothetical protein|nr:caspase family protein [Methylomirabilota bacterium]